MLYPAELRYSKSHEWVKTEDGVTVVASPTLPRTRWATWCS